MKTRRDLVGPWKGVGIALLGVALLGCEPDLLDGNGCSDDDDCAGDLLCKSSTCARKCSTDADCAAKQYCESCVEQSCERVCVAGCKTNTECGVTSRCDRSAHVCTPHCATDLDCMEGWPERRCIETAGTKRCGIPCAADTECAAPDRCICGNCAPPCDASGGCADLSTAVCVELDGCATPQCFVK